MKPILVLLIVAIAILSSACRTKTEQGPLPEDSRIENAINMLDEAGKKDAVILQIDEALAEEGFEIKQEDDQAVVTGGSPAGVLYGTQEYLMVPEGTGKQEPDFDLRGTVLFLMKDGSYDFSYSGFC